jgi:hypothetical protein
MVFDVPPRLAGVDRIMDLGRIDEADTTFVNGTQIGTTADWIAPRRYRVPGSLIVAGRNVIAIRIWDRMIHGGMCGDPSQMVLHTDRDPGLYHPDWRDEFTQADFPLADDPYRYARW